MDEQAPKGCKVCKKTEDETALNKCPICFALYCDEHGYSMSGREFCSKHCANYFFFASEDDE